MAGYRRNTQRRSSRRGSNTSSLGWVWLFLGMFLGIAGAIFAYGLYSGQWSLTTQKSAKLAPTVVVTPPTTTTAEKTRTSTHIQVQNKNGKTQDFEFYTLLPGMEVQLPDAPSKPADARAAQVAQASQSTHANQASQTTQSTAAAHAPHASTHTTTHGKSKLEAHQKNTAQRNHPQASSQTKQIKPQNASHASSANHANSVSHDTKNKSQGNNHHGNTSHAGHNVNNSHGNRNSHTMNSSHSKKLVSKEKTRKKNDSKNPFAKLFAKKSSKDSKPKASLKTNTQKTAAGQQQAAAATVAKKIAATRYILQTGIFRESKQADTLKSKLASQGFNSQIQKVKTQDGNSWFRVTLGPYSTSPQQYPRKRSWKQKTSAVP